MSFICLEFCAFFFFFNFLVLKCKNWVIVDTCVNLPITCYLVNQELKCHGIASSDFMNILVPLPQNFCRHFLMLHVVVFSVTDLKVREHLRM